VWIKLNVLEITDTLIGTGLQLSSLEWLMTDSLTASYFRALSVRCLTIARDCFDCRAKEELGKLAQEFTAKADALEDQRYSTVCRSFKGETKSVGPVTPGRERAWEGSLHADPTPHT